MQPWRKEACGINKTFQKCAHIIFPYLAYCALTNASNTVKYRFILQIDTYIYSVHGIALTKLTNIIMNICQRRLPTIGNLETNDQGKNVWTSEKLLSKEEGRAAPSLNFPAKGNVTWRENRDESGVYPWFSNTAASVVCQSTVLVSYVLT